MYEYLFFPDPQLHLCREELHHHLPVAHRPLVAVHEQGHRQGGEGGLEMGQAKGAGWLFKASHIERNCNFIDEE